MEPIECQYHTNCGGYCETEEERYGEYTLYSNERPRRAEAIGGKP